MLEELFQPGKPTPTNKQEAVEYVEQIALGLIWWAAINILMVSCAILLYVVGAMPAQMFVLVAFFAVGCPIVMTVGLFIKSLEYLTVKECYEIVKHKLVT